MRVATLLAAWLSSLMLLGCRLDFAFKSNRENLVAQQELITLMRDVARTSVSADFRTLTGVQNLGLTFALASTRLSCDADSTGNPGRNALGVPIDLTYSWSAERCAPGIGTTERTFGGVTRVQDLGGRFGVRVTHENLVGTMSTPGSRQRYSLSGVAEVHAPDATVATIVQRITDKSETLTPSQSGIVTRIRDLSLSVVDSLGVPRSVAPSARGPNLFSIKGTYIVVTEGNWKDSVHLEISTAVPLRADASCPSGYRAGTVRAVVSGVVNDVAVMTYNCR